MPHGLQAVNESFMNVKGLKQGQNPFSETNRRIKEIKIKLTNGASTYGAGMLVGAVPHIVM
jgi:hypothetical protein